MIRFHKLRIFIRLVAGSGAVPRRILGRLLGLVAWVPARGPVATVPLTAAVLSSHLLGSGSAVADAARIGLDPRSDRAVALRTARLAFELDDPWTAERILARRTGLVADRAVLLLTAEIDWRLGRYRAALDAARQVQTSRPRDREAAHLAALASSELIVLDPSWRPPVRPISSRPTPIRGRVLHLLTNSLPYRQAGYTLRAQSVGRCQIGVGLDPHLATRAGFPRSDGIRHAPATEVLDGVRYHRLDPDLPSRAGSERIVMATAAAARDLIAELRPAVLHPASNHLNATAALALGETFGLPVVYEVRGFLEETWSSRAGGDVTDSERYLASREIETACMRAAAAVVTLSETMRADIVDRGGIDPAKVVVVPNAVDLDRFVAGPRNEALAGRLGLGDGPVIGYISTFTSYEGIRYLIEAAAELKRRGHRFNCLLVGDGEERAALEAVADAAGVLDGTVIFTGRVPYVAILDYYRLIDVFVVPRTNDRVSQLVTPLKPYEAMATERAVVVSAVGALLEIVTDGETGRSFTPEDPIALADTVEPLLDDPAERARLGRAARLWVGEHRTWDHNGRRYLDLYRALGVA